MFAGQEEIVASTAQVEIGIAPGMEVGATSERETGVVSRALACVVDEDDGEMESPREFAQSPENGRNLGGIIFVDGLKTDIWVQNQKLGPVEGEGFAKPGKMVGSVEPEDRLEDKLHIKRVEVCSTCFELAPRYVRVFVRENPRRHRRAPVRVDKLRSGLDRAGAKPPLQRFPKRAMSCRIGNVACHITQIMVRTRLCGEVTASY